MSLLEHNEIYLDEGQLIQVDRSPLKKVVHL
jgi:hypothetical protein